MFRLTVDAKQYLKAMDKMPQALAKATARTLNSMARAALAASGKNLDGRMVIRATYTKNSLRFYPAAENPPKPIERQNTVVGSVSPYLPIQDSGGTVRGKKGRIPVPTDALRGSDRRKKITSKMKMNHLGEFNTKGGRFFKTKNGIYYRKSKHKIVKVRDIRQRSYKIKPTHWHTDAVKAQARVNVVSAMFIREAKKVLAEIGAK